MSVYSTSESRWLERMRITGIIWLERVVEKLHRKHAVREHEVVEVLDSRPEIRFAEKGHRPGEDVYAALGRTEAGRYLTVFFILKDSGNALILSAREMASHERRRYGRR